MGHRNIEQGTRYTERGEYTGYKVARKGSDVTHELGNTRQHPNKKELTYEVKVRQKGGGGKIIYRTLTSLKEDLGIKRNTPKT